MTKRRARVRVPPLRIEGSAFTVGVLLCIGRWGDLWGTNGSRNGSQQWDTPKRPLDYQHFPDFL